MAENLKQSKHSVLVLLIPFGIFIEILIENAGKVYSTLELPMRDIYKYIILTNYK